LRRLDRFHSVWVDGSTPPVPPLISSARPCPPFDLVSPILRQSLTATDLSNRIAYALKDVFEALSAAEKDGGISDEKKKELEDKAAQMGLHALFKVRLLVSVFSKIRH
jgi:hypothetical protein